MIARRLRGVCAVVLAASGASAAWAQEPPVPLLRGEVADLERCLRDTPDNPRVCAGRLAGRCQEQPEGGTTPGTVACLRQETELWDRLLNTRYAALTERTRERMTEGGPDAVASLRDAQRKWIRYRDAECARIVDYWAAGTIRGPAHASCMLAETAGRAIQLDPDENP